jgi:cell wall-associated NlpC family hydrolase
VGLDGIAAVQARITQIQQQVTAALTPARSNAVDFETTLQQALATEPAAPPSSSPVVAGSQTLSDFVSTALAQSGDQYIWGAHTSPSDPDPAAFDCSELTKWAAARVGVTIPDGAVAQYLQIKEHGTLMSVDEALRTPGALLFRYNHEPTGPGDIPSDSHVAISLGDGRTIEARGRNYGVGIFDAKDRFNYAGVIPSMR